MPRSRVGSNVVDLNLLLASTAPLSWDDRMSLLHMLETDFKDVCHTQQHRSDEEVKRDILKRVSFSHFPGLSVCDEGCESVFGDVASTSSSSSSSSSSYISSLSYGGRGAPSIPSSIDESGTASKSSSSSSSSLPPLESSMLVRPLEKGSHMICKVIRQKSTLHTTYKMYLENILTSNESSNFSSSSSGSNGGSSNGRSDANANAAANAGAGASANASDNDQPMLIAKMSSGLTLSCSIHSFLEGRQGEEASSLIAKVTKSGKYYSISPANASSQKSASLGTCGRAKVSMRYRVMDKIIYLDCVADLKSNSDETQKNNSDVDEITLQSSLEKIKKNESVLLPGSLFGLRTRKPRYTSTKEHQVSFGGVGRSRTPSKKNVVLETVDGRSAEWAQATNDLDAYPPFQLGKKAEDHFSLDFSDLSPAQAFGIALAVFAQT